MTTRQDPIRLCFVCLGNICRSPTAEGIMRKLVRDEGLDDRIVVESAGTGAWHLGERADSRARATASERGVTLDRRAQQFRTKDFDRFDYVLVMDEDIGETLGRLTSSAAARERIHVLRSFDPDAPRGARVPDPYYGGPEGFEEVFDICEAACRGLLAHLRATHALPLASPGADPAANPGTNPGATPGASRPASPEASRDVRPADTRR